MRIPSYDDLTPSIPDVSPGDVFSAGGVLSLRGSDEEPDLASAAGVAGGVRSAEGEGSGELYAALHDPAEGAVERLAAIARDFSPRIERHRGGTVVLDVSG